MERKYKQPIIKRIKLDPSQAVLQACVVVGAYFDFGSTRCIGSNGTGAPTARNCRVSVKGAKTTASTRRATYSLSAMPS